MQRVSSEVVAYEDLFAKLERERGFRGTLYRPRCLRRRVAVRMRARGVNDPREYSKLLDEDPAEYDRLIRTLTINVSRFFRNPQTWESIRTLVLPDLARRERPLLIWSAGSAAGEEAYSLAILLYQHLLPRGEGAMKGIRIIGTDIDEDALERARRASYPEMALSETPEKLRRRWFSAEEPYRLKASIRSLVEFQALDVLSQRPGFAADLILCRNLLIYLDRAAQNQVFEMFAETLKPGGYLVLGRVEMLGQEARRRYEIVDARERIYRKL